jgi:hypothetical protein
VVIAVVAVNALPPVAAAYHCKSVPVAVKLATVGLPQKVCAAAVGAETLNATLTAVLGHNRFL